MVLVGLWQTRTVKRWQDKFMGGHHLQRVVDVDKVRTSIVCCLCAGWTTFKLNREEVGKSV